MDNADGKQARKTGNSSPLGMLFDHGCDSLTTYFLIATSVCLTRGVCFNDGFSLVLLLSTFSNIFYNAVMECYFCGGLNLPCFNGPNEGNMTL